MLLYQSWCMELMKVLSVACMRSRALAASRASGTSARICCTACSQIASFQIQYCEASMEAAMALSTSLIRSVSQSSTSCSNVLWCLIDVIHLRLLKRNASEAQPTADRLRRRKILSIASGKNVPCANAGRLQAFRVTNTHFNAFPGALDAPQQLLGSHGMACMLGDRRLAGRLPSSHLKMLLDGIELCHELLEEARGLSLKAALD